ncbi:MAG: flavin reductase family protein [Chloroflexi bacterium]|nr:flavin reductase family protein [Chloroflexota bacterium]
MAIEKDFFRQVMGRFATGVTVVTAKNEDTIGGITVNAFCSVSLNPPLVLVCIDLNSNTLPIIRQSGAFAVNMLTDQQEHLSRCFALSSPERYEHFCHTNYHTSATGAPILDDVLAFIDARIVAEHPGGDHAIFLGEVEAMGIGSKIAFVDEASHATLATLNGHIPVEEENPLAYYRGQYRHLAIHYRQPSLATPPEQDRN